jgi:hypothetical protein
MKIEEVNNNMTLNSCKDEYNFYKYDCIESKPIIITKDTPYPYNYNPVVSKSKDIDKNKIENTFQIIKDRYKKSTDTTKYREYSSLLKSLEKNQTKSLTTIDTIDYLIYLVSTELQYINNKYCDDISEMLGICELKN